MSESLTYRSPRVALVEPGQADLHARDMTATFAGDLTLAAAQELLAPSNQWLPIDGDPDVTLAHLIDTDSTGPLRLGYGAWRDLLLGVQFTNGKGELISAGGRTVKNVAGYDLTKFMVGQAGVFGRIVTLTTRTYLQPAIALLARTEPRAGIVAQLIATPCRPHWAMLTREHLLLGYLGEKDLIDYQHATLPRYISADLVERSPSEDQTDRAGLWKADGAIGFRASLPPSRVEQFVQTISITHWVADPAFGIVLGSVDSFIDLKPVMSAARAVGGSVRSLGSGAPHERLVSGSDAECKIAAKLKNAFDPDGRLDALPGWSRS